MKWQKIFEVVRCCTGGWGVRFPCFSKRFPRCASGLMHSPEEIPESQKDCTEAMDNENLYGAGLSLCYLESEQWKENMKGER